MNNNVKTQWMLVTPEMAKEYLVHNSNNRAIRSAKLAQYVADLKANRWGYSEDPIAFDVNGRLINGQHRLTAVAISGIATMFRVGTGFPTDAVFDIGVARTTADALWMQGTIPKEASTTNLLGGVGIYLAATKDTTARFVTTQEKGEFISANLELCLEAQRMSKIKGPRPVCFNAPTIAALMGAIKRNEDASELQEFCACANSGYIDCPEQSAAITYRNFRQGKQGGDDPSRMYQTKIAEMAINDYMRGKPRKMLYTKPKHIYLLREI